MVIDNLQNASLYFGLHKNFQLAFEYLQQTDFSQVDNGKYELDGENVFAIVNRYETHSAEELKWEAHRKYIDIQFVSKGFEQIGIEDINEVPPLTEYDEENDVRFFIGGGNHFPLIEKTSIIYLANPNNPTGTMFTKNEFDLFIQKVPENILIVLDDACTIYVENNPDYPNGFDYNLPNLIVVRSLSKTYGLAGLRIGFAIGPPVLIRELYKVKLPFEPNALAQAAASAALDDDDFLKRTVELNKISLKILGDKFDEFGIDYVPTFTNFFLMIFPTEELAFIFVEECLSKGLILRHVKPFGIPNCVRINSGTLDETEFALTIMENIFSKLKHQMKKQ